MSASLKASFILSLEDKLSAGLAKITQQLEALAKLGRDLQLPGLTGSGRELDRLGNSVDTTVGKIDAIGKAAKRARDEVRRLGDPIVASAGGGARLQASFQTSAMAAAVAASVTAGGGRAPAIPASVLLAQPAPVVSAATAIAPPRLDPATGLAIKLSALEGRLNAVGAAAGGAVEKLGMMASVVAGVSLAVPVQRAAHYDQQLRDIGLTGETARADMPAELERLRGIIDPLARETSQSNTGLSDAMGVMIGKGMASEVIEKMLPVVARLSTAANADPKMLAALAYTLGQNLKVGPEELTAALGGLLIAGKAGGFELKDMAQHFPAVAVAGGMIGLTGASGTASLAALAQVSADVAGPTEPGEAATGMRHFLGSLTSPAGIKHWAQQGVDITRMLTSAREQGIYPIEAVTQKLREITAGKNPEDTAKTIGAIFHDEYTRRTALALMNDPDKYLRIRAAARNRDDADPRKNANLVVDHDFRTQMDGMLRQLARIEEGGSQLVQRFGREIFSA